MILPNDFIEQVKLANNIVAVASRYMSLQNKGRQHWACCPFHSEKTPSFSVTEDRQMYYCFGCKEKGNVITLVRKLENLDFPDAVKLLAKWAGLKIPETLRDPAEIEKTRHKQKILAIVEDARDFYCKVLTTPPPAGAPLHTGGEPVSREGKNSPPLWRGGTGKASDGVVQDRVAHVALEYLHSRGITDELIKLFNLGLSPDWDSLITHLRAKGYTEKDLLDAGVAAKSQKGKIYDALAGRITFAIFDVYGNCIGFQARILPANDTGEIAKYKNTAQTVAFDKGSIVYGLDVLKKNKKGASIDKLIVVEGNVDVISLVGAGFVNTVAFMGTAVTQFHARTIKRYCDQIYICFDGDDSGQKAALRSLDILVAEGLSVRVIQLPKDTDPDDFIRKNGKAAFQKLIDTAKPLVDFKLDYLASTSDLRDNLGKTKYLNAATEILKTLRGPEVELYVPKVAETAGVSRESILRSANHAGGYREPAFDKNKKLTPLPGGVAPRSGDGVVKDVAHQRTLDFVIASKLHHKRYAEAPLEFDLDMEDAGHLLNYKFHGSEQDQEKYYQDCIKTLLRNENIKKRDELQKIYEETNEGLDKIQELNRRIKNG